MGGKLAVIVIGNGALGIFTLTLPEHRHRHGKQPGAELAYPGSVMQNDAAGEALADQIGQAAQSSEIGG